MASEGFVVQTTSVLLELLQMNFFLVEFEEEKNAKRESGRRTFLMKSLFLNFRN